MAACKSGGLHTSALTNVGCILASLLHANQIAKRAGRRTHGPPLWEIHEAASESLLADQCARFVRRAVEWSEWVDR